MTSNQLVSIIIPCFNCEKFIGETIESVLNQSYQNFEIIIINDGSTDKSEEIILKFQEPRIKYVKKENAGVSDTRNKGVTISKGDYLIFLDADDILAPTFIASRLKFLIENPTVGFCCGDVLNIDENSSSLPGLSKGAYTNVINDILLYNPNANTCPSNYLIRRNVLIQNSIRFNITLSSTADRLFLIELANVSTGGYVNGGELLYRISSTSMSHNLTLKLVDDNARFYKFISELDFIPKDIFKQFTFKMNYILGAAYLRLKSYNKGIFYLYKSFAVSPKNFSKIILSKLN